jgi:hypothetical protein
MVVIAVSSFAVGENRLGMTLADIPPAQDARLKQVCALASRIGSSSKRNLTTRSTAGAGPAVQFFSGRPIYLFYL